MKVWILVFSWWIFSPSAFAGEPPSQTHFLAPLEQRFSQGSRLLGKIPGSLQEKDLHFLPQGGGVSFLTSSPDGKSAWVFNGKQFAYFDEIKPLLATRTGDILYLAREEKNWVLRNNEANAATWEKLGDLTLSPQGNKFLNWGCLKEKDDNSICKDTLLINGRVEPQPLQAYPMVGQPIVVSPEEDRYAYVWDFENYKELTLNGKRVSFERLQIRIHDLYLGHKGNFVFVHRPVDVGEHADGEYVTKRGKEWGPFEVAFTFPESADYDVFKFRKFDKETTFHEADDTPDMKLYFRGQVYKNPCPKIMDFVLSKGGKEFLFLCYDDGKHLDFAVWHGKKIQSPFYVFYGDDLYYVVDQKDHSVLMKNGDKFLERSEPIRAFITSPDGKNQALALNKSGELHTEWIGVQPEAQSAGGFPAWSPAGNHLVFFQRSGGVNSLVVDGQKVKGEWGTIYGLQHLPWESFSAKSPFLFSPDGNSVGFYARKGDEIWWVVEKLPSSPHS